MVLVQDSHRSPFCSNFVDKTQLSLPPVRPPKNRARLELARRELLLAELDGIDGLSWGVSDKGPLVVNAMERVEEALAAM